MRLEGREATHPLRPGLHAESLSAGREFQPFFGATGNVFVEAPGMPGTPGEIALILPGEPGITTIYENFNLSFTDKGTIRARSGLIHPG
jgi:hypothetical protein